MKRIIIQEMPEGRGWQAWIERVKGKQVFRLTDVCMGSTRAEAAGKLLLGYPEVTGLTVGTIYREEVAL